jgi:hypothetical protein
MDGIGTVCARESGDRVGKWDGIAFDKIFKYSKSTSISIQILRISNKNHKLLVNEDVLYEQSTTC